MYYTKDNIKYCLLTWNHLIHSHIKSFTDQDITISGLYNWAKVFNGDYDFPKFPSEFEKYNLIHLNLTPHNLPLISQLIPQLNRNQTELLVNVDHAIEMWHTAYPNPSLFLQELDRADYIFAVEENMSNLLSQALKRKVACIPHPVPVDKLKQFRTTQRAQRIIISAHRYDKSTLLPWFACKECLNPPWITGIVGASSFQSNAIQLYNELQPQLNFCDLMKYIGGSYALIDSYTVHSYGRITIECAALGVPCIGPDIVSSQRKCFPDLTIKINDIKHMTALLMQLVNDLDFHAQCGMYGLDKAESFSFDSCSKLMLEFLNSPQ